LKKVSVIGSGIGGLAVAIRLKIRGYDVRVFEASASYGGKVSQIQNNGFRFDKGPSLLTMPDKIDELFKLANKKPADYFEYFELEESFRYFYEDGTVIRAYSDNEKLKNEIYEKTNVPKKTIQRYLDKNTFIFNATNHLFLEKSLHKLKSYISFRVLLSFFKLPFLNLFRTMNQVNKKTFNNEKITQLFNRYATYNGSNPYLAPGLFNSISHLELTKGAYYPKGGMRSIAKSLYTLALELGVVFMFNSRVKKIIVKREGVKSIISKKKEYESDIIVCNSDIHYVYNNLLDRKTVANYYKKNERSSSAIIFYWGINRLFDKLKLHNILFSENYKEEFDYIRKGKIYNDPTIYINITSKKIKSDAPIGKENWFVMINTPHNSGQFSKNKIQQIKKDIVIKINRMLDTNIETHIVSEHIVDPKTIENETLSFAGALYGTSSNTKSSAFFRHPNFSKETQGLYFCGGSVHPGGGIPLALSSAKIVDDLIS
tara:strand:- start:203 stop:1660 length:1458 start_codon:yes stop_codon:yes gene_type:complete